MGVIHGEWTFDTLDAPSPENVVEALRDRSGLEISCTYGDDGSLGRVDMPQIRESLFGWTHAPDRLSVRSFIPAHPYLWTQLQAVMTELGGRISETTYAWRPETHDSRLDRPWLELSRRQRFVLAMPTIGAWRPFDFLAQRQG